MTSPPFLVSSPVRDNGFGDGLLKNVQMKTTPRYTIHFIVVLSEAQGPSCTDLPRKSTLATVDRCPLVSFG